MGARKLTQTQEDEVLLQYECGRPLAEIGADYSLHPTYVRILARRRGVAAKNCRERRDRWKDFLAFESSLENEAVCTVDLSRAPFLAHVFLGQKHPDEL